jgi:prevent-host-death family protein
MNEICVGAEQFRREMSDLLNRVRYGNERVIVEKHGAPQVAVIPYTLYRRLAEPVEQLQDQPPSNEALRQMLVAQGIIRPLAPTTTNRQQSTARRLIETKGKPLSEIIIEERR